MSFLHIPSMVKIRMEQLGDCSISMKPTVRRIMSKSCSQVHILTPGTISYVYFLVVGMCVMLNSAGGEVTCTRRTHMRRVTFAPGITARVPLGECQVSQTYYIRPDVSGDVNSNYKVIGLDCCCQVTNYRLRRVSFRGVTRSFKEILDCACLPCE
ncbi:uncharacterized protein [Ptychodera flava]|uniref:uncharacterized protein n=1 Tax=Ptychodera flava TaxID=63121 RepID=UPI00396A4DF3